MENQPKSKFLQELGEYANAIQEKTIKAANEVGKDDAPTVIFLASDKGQYSAMAQGQGFAILELLANFLDDQPDLREALLDYWEFRAKKMLKAVNPNNSKIS